MRCVRTGRAMFLTCCSPISSNEKSSLSRTCSCAAALMQIPPGSASASRRAAMLTPSPKMSPSSMMMSLTLTPMRNSIRRHGGIAGGHFALQLDGTAHGVNHTGEFNKEAVAGGFDDATAVLGDLGVAQLSEDRAQCRERALLIFAHQPRIASNINSEDRCQPALDPLSAHPAGPATRCSTDTMMEVGRMRAASALRIPHRRSAAHEDHHPSGGLSPMPSRALQ